MALLVPVMFAATAYITERALDIAQLAVEMKFTGAMPYLVAIVTPAWASITTILGFYFTKAKTENKAKIETKSTINQMRDA